MSANAVPEHDSKKFQDKSINVDRHYATDQFGVRGPALKMLESRAIAGSLITYTENPTWATTSTAGTIKNIAELRGRLGVPTLVEEPM